jgi:hypothetical protein
MRRGLVMRRIIEKRVYDTEVSVYIADNWNGLMQEDDRYCEERLYKTKKGNYFLYGSGGPLSKYSKTIGNKILGITILIPLTIEEAYDWLKTHNETEAIEEFFNGEKSSNMIII